MPENSVADRRERIDNCYQRGLRLTSHEKNYDYAHVMFSQCVAHDPSNLVYAESLLKNLREKFSDRKKRKSAFSLGGVSRTLKKAQQRQEWPEVLLAGIELLAANPWDVNALRAMADASAAQHHNEVELVYLKQALDADPKNVEVNRHCARSLGRMGQFDQAIACWHRIEGLKGKDEEAVRMISSLVEEKLRYPNGRPTAAQATASAKQTAAIADEQHTQSPHELTLTRQQLLERSIADDPKNLTNQLQLADLLLESELYGSAESALKRAIVACGEQPGLTERLERARSLIAQQELAAAEARLAAERQNQKEPFRMPWLELTLVGAAVGLALQLYPPAAAATWRVVDVREWPRWAWFLLNLAVLLALAAVRFAPELRAFWQDGQPRRKRRTTSGKR